MKIAIIIPAHNEEHLIEKTLSSLLGQSVKASKIIVVNDNSTDRTSNIVSKLAKQGIELIERKSTAANIPGSKVIEAFNHGLQTLELSCYDIICKFDADLIFPPDYLEKICLRFSSNIKAGIVGGHCTIERNGDWILESQNNPDHIRGALKAYRTECFKEIGALKNSIGWDTADEMLARFYNWEVISIPDLFVKHLKPTGSAYKSKSMKHQGEAMYKLRMGWVLTFITGLKMAIKSKNIRTLSGYLFGYAFAKSNNVHTLLNKEEGKFIRKYRWKGIKAKLGL